MYISLLQHVSCQSYAYLFTLLTLLSCFTFRAQKFLGFIRRNETFFFKQPFKGYNMNTETQKKCIEYALEHPSECSWGMCRSSVHQCSSPVVILKPLSPVPVWSSTGGSHI